MKRIAIAIAIAGCSGPTPTGTTCADPDPITGTTTLTWDNFGHDFMFKYCTNCHSRSLTINYRNGATWDHDFDMLEYVMEIAGGTSDHIDEQAGWGPKAHNNYMPGDGTDGRCPSVPGGPLDEACPEPTGEERTNLAQWLACERGRPHYFPHDAGID